MGVINLVCLPPEIPTMQKLLCFSDKKLNITEQVGVNYITFGTLLLEDNSGAIVKGFENEYLRNAGRINYAILQRWLHGSGLKPVTWSTLITVLEKIGM